MIRKSAKRFSEEIMLKARKLIALKKETIMHGIIESLSPEHGQIDWKWVGSVFAFYVVVMIGGTGLLLAH